MLKKVLLVFAWAALFLYVVYSVYGAMILNIDFSGGSGDIPSSDSDVQFYLQFYNTTEAELQIRKHADQCRKDGGRIKRPCLMWDVQRLNAYDLYHLFVERTREE